MKDAISYWKIWAISGKSPAVPIVVSGKTRKAAKEAVGGAVLKVVGPFPSSLAALRG